MIKYIKYFFTSIFFISLSFRCASQVLDQVVPKLQTYPPAHFREMISVRTSKLVFTCSLDSISINLRLKNRDTLVFVISTHGNNQIHEIPYKGTRPFYPLAYLIDIDGNGYKDIIVVCSECESEIVIYAFLRYPNNRLVTYELCSGIGGIELFRDFDKDGQYEFACIKYIAEWFYYGINIFKFTPSGLINISDSIQPFPLAFININK